MVRTDLIQDVALKSFINAVNKEHKISYTFKYQVQLHFTSLVASSSSVLFPPPRSSPRLYCLCIIYECRRPPGLLIRLTHNDQLVSSWTARHFTPVTHYPHLHWRSLSEVFLFWVSANSVSVQAASISLFVPMEECACFRSSSHILWFLNYLSIDQNTCSTPLLTTTFIFFN